MKFEITDTFLSLPQCVFSELCNRLPEQAAGLMDGSVQHPSLSHIQRFQLDVSIVICDGTFFEVKDDLYSRCTLGKSLLFEICSLVPPVCAYVCLRPIALIRESRDYLVSSRRIEPKSFGTACSLILCNQWLNISPIMIP